MTIEQLITDEEIKELVHFKESRMNCWTPAMPIRRDQLSQCMNWLNRHSVKPGNIKIVGSDKNKTFIMYYRG
jgi:hypothetical protein